MPTCQTCGTEISGIAEMECDVCGESFCRDHYHSHECDDPEAEPAQANGGSSAPSPAVLGYGIAVFLGLVGSFYLLAGMQFVLLGGSSEESLSALVEMIAAGGIFAAATFVLLGTYIASQ